MNSVKIITANKNNKQAISDWEDFRLQIFNSTTVDLNETEEEKTKRIKHLESKPEEWFEYYFPKFYFSKPADFQIKSTLKVLKANRFKQGRRWFRGSSKSTRRMMELFFKMFAQKFRVNCLLVSKTAENAERLLKPYRANLEANQRLINDYGTQEKPGSWSESEFTTRSGHSFRAVGAEQNPRGARLDELRITAIVFDDVDDDEVCRNPDRVQQRWEWIERAVIPTVDISGNYLIFFDNNVIAEDSCASRFAEFADDIETINIRDQYGQSSWPEKNSEKDIDDILNSISYAAAQAEYFNNPYSEGKVFKEITYGNCPPLNDFKFVIVYADPAPSNRDRPGVKSKIQNSCKAVVVAGYHDKKYYVLKSFVDNTTNATFIDWLYATRDWINQKTQPFFYIENNTLQNPFYEQVLLPLIFKKGEEKNKTVLNIIPDDRQKPDKYFRIEGNLEPLNRNGILILNQDEKNNPHMKRLEAQFKSVSANSKTMDGPDAVEGAVHIINNKIELQAAQGVLFIPKQKNKKRF